MKYFFIFTLFLSFLMVSLARAETGDEIAEFLSNSENLESNPRMRAPFVSIFSWAAQKAFSERTGQRPKSLSREALELVVGDGSSEKIQDAANTIGSTALAKMIDNSSESWSIVWAEIESNHPSLAVMGEAEVKRQAISATLALSELNDSPIYEDIPEDITIQFCLWIIFCNPWVDK